MVDDLSGMSVRELLTGYARSLEELRRRRVVRSNNAPAGDYAELLVAKALKGRLVDNSVKSLDVVLPGKVRVQVKTRMVSDPPTPGQLQTSPFRSWDFDRLALVQLRASDYEVRRAVLLPVHVAKEHASPRPHVNGEVVFMRAALLDHSEAKDITEKLRSAASSL